MLVSTTEYQKTSREEQRMYRTKMLQDVRKLSRLAVRAAMPPKTAIHSFRVYYPSYDRLRVRMRKVA